MNNEFNNDNMNQIQNNNMSSQYSSDYNNLNNNKVGNNGKNDKWKDTLILILVIIVFILIALSLYFVVTMKVDNNKDNNIQENENNKDNVQGENNDNTELEKKVLDEHYFKSIDIINKHILEHRYSAIVNKELSYERFYKAYIAKSIIDSLEPVGNIGCDDTKTENVEYDKNGVKYPVYCGGSRCAENYAKDFGLTVEEISKIDKYVFPNIVGGGGGGYCIYMYDAAQIKDKYIDIYNDVFSSSFSIYLSDELNGPTDGYIYDKNIDKIITDGYGGTAGLDERVIIESKEESNLYKVKFVEGHFSPGGKWMSLDIDSNEDISDSSEAKADIERNKNRLPNYEIVFEKVSTGYKFKEINRVS